MDGSASLAQSNMCAGLDVCSSESTARQGWAFALSKNWSGDTSCAEFSSEGPREVFSLHLVPTVGRTQCLRLENWRPHFPTSLWPHCSSGASSSSFVTLWWPADIFQEESLPGLIVGSHVHNCGSTQQRPLASSWAKDQGVSGTRDWGPLSKDHL